MNTIVPAMAMALFGLGVYKLIMVMTGAPSFIAVDCFSSSYSCCMVYY